MDWLVGLYVVVFMLVNSADSSEMLDFVASDMGWDFVCLFGLMLNQYSTSNWQQPFLNHR